MNKFNFGIPFARSPGTGWANRASGNKSTKSNKYPDSTKALDDIATKNKTASFRFLGGTMNRILRRKHKVGSEKEAIKAEGAVRAKEMVEAGTAEAFLDRYDELKEEMVTGSQASPTVHFETLMNELADAFEMTEEMAGEVLNHLTALREKGAIGSNPENTPPLFPQEIKILEEIYVAKRKQLVGKDEETVINETKAAFKVESRFADPRTVERELKKIVQAESTSTPENINLNLGQQNDLTPPAEVHLTLDHIDILRDVHAQLRPTDAEAMARAANAAVKMFPEGTSEAEILKELWKIAEGKPTSARPAPLPTDQDKILREIFADLSRTAHDVNEAFTLAESEFAGRFPQVSNAAIVENLWEIAQERLLSAERMSSDEIELLDDLYKQELSCANSAGAAFNLTLSQFAHMFSDIPEGVITEQLTKIVQENTTLTPANIEPGLDEEKLRELDQMYETTRIEYSNPLYARLQAAEEFLEVYKDSNHSKKSLVRLIEEREKQRQPEQPKLLVPTQP